MGPEAARAAVSGISISASTTTTSSTGKELSVSLETRHTTDRRYADWFTFSLALPSGDESHRWTFAPRAGGFNVNGDGKGTLTMGTTATHGVAKLEVSVTPTGKFTTHKCSGKVVSKSRNVRVKGVYFNNSKSSNWGQVGDKTKKSFVLKGTYTVRYKGSCHGARNPSCHTSLSWWLSQGDLATDEDIGGHSSGEESYAFGYRRTGVPGRFGERVDYVRSPTAGKLVLNVLPDGNATLDVWAGSGSGVLASNDPNDTYKDDCGKDKKQVEDVWRATLTISSGPFEMPMEAARPIVVAKDSASNSYVYIFNDYPKG